MPRRALVHPVPADIVAELEHELRLSPLIARLFALRGVHGAEQAKPSSPSAWPICTAPS
mgnify:CR=1 FL=1